MDIMLSQWHMGDTSSLRAMNFFTMNPIPERCPGPRPKEGVTSTKFLKAAFVSKMNFPESCSVNIEMG